MICEVSKSGIKEADEFISVTLHIDTNLEDSVRFILFSFQWYQTQRFKILCDILILRFNSTWRILLLETPICLLKLVTTLQLLHLSSDAKHVFHTTSLVGRLIPKFWQKYSYWNLPVAAWRHCKTADRSADNISIECHQSIVTRSCPKLSGSVRPPHR